jgi:hypothetical protein
LAVGEVELEAVLGKAIDVGRLDLRIPVAAEIVVHVVHRDEQDVHFLLSAVGR